MEQYQIYHPAEIHDLLAKLYAMPMKEVAHELCNITMSHHIEENYLSGMARRFHNPDRHELIYKADGRAMIDALLEYYEPDLGNNQMVVGLLRGTYIARHELPHWKICRNRIHHYVAETEGLQFADRILRGLMKDEL